MFYAFQLGHQPKISLAEIKTVFLSKKIDFTIETTQQNYLIIQTKKKLNSTELIKQLGGTIKICSEIKSDKNNFLKSIKEHLFNVQPEGKIQFSFPDKKMGLEIKKELKNNDRSARYIEPKNSATIIHNHLIEKKGDLNIIAKHLFMTEAVQQFEEMSQRDYDRPGIDDKSGMLPPKLAKIMINLALSQNIDYKKNLLDPFCGSGTILTEAAVMGYQNLYGSDISEKAITDTKKNLDWIIKNYNLKNIQYHLNQINVTKLSQSLDNNSLDLIITEPYLGKPLHGNESNIYLTKQSEELKNLYLQAFEQFQKILKPDGIIVIAIPQFKTKSDWIKIDCIDKIKNIGFEIIPFNNENYLLYHRPNQHLGRGIWRFKKI